MSTQPHNSLRGFVRILILIIGVIVCVRACTSYLEDQRKEDRRKAAERQALKEAFDGLAENARNRHASLREQQETDMLRYYNNSHALAALGAASSCLNRCLSANTTTHSCPTPDGLYTVTLTLPAIDAATYESVYNDIFGEQHSALLADNKAIISSLKGRKISRFKHLEARATDTPFNGSLKLRCGGTITIRPLAQ